MSYFRSVSDIPSGKTLLQVIQSLPDYKSIYRYNGSTSDSPESSQTYRYIIIPFNSVGYCLTIAIQAAFDSKAYYCITNYNGTIKWDWHRIDNS